MIRSVGMGLSSKCLRGFFQEAAKNSPFVSCLFYTLSLRDTYTSIPMTPRTHTYTHAMQLYPFRTHLRNNNKSIIMRHLVRSLRSRSEPAVGRQISATGRGGLKGEREKGEFRGRGEGGGISVLPRRDKSANERRRDERKDSYYSPVILYITDGPIAPESVCDCEAPLQGLLRGLVLVGVT